MNMRRVGIPALVVAIVVVVLAPAAHAALFLVFETNSFQPEGYVVPRTGGIGAPGDVVRARTGGRGAVATGQVMPAFLARGAYPSKVDSADDLVGKDGLTPIGELRTGANGNGYLSFETPDLAPGGYKIVLYCDSCAPFMDGENVVAAAPFRVKPTQAAAQRSPETRASSPWIGLALVSGPVFALGLLRWRSAQRAREAEGSRGLTEVAGPPA